MLTRIDLHVAPRLCVAQGMVHASRCHEFLEDALLRWLDEYGLPYGALRARGLDLVVGTAKVHYRAPERLGDHLRVPEERELTSPALLTRLHAAQALFYSGGSSGPLEDMLHPDVSWHVPGRSAISGEYAGRSAVIAYMERRRDLADRSSELDPGEVLVGPCHVAALTSGSAVSACPRFPADPAKIAAR